MTASRQKNGIAPRLKVLVFPGGTEIGLEVNRALGELKNIELHAAGTVASNHAPYVYRHWHVLPSIHDAEWIAPLNEVIREHGIDVIIPAYDDIIVALAENQDKIAATIVTSPVRTCQITRSKRDTYNLLKEVMRVPALYPSIADVKAYPVFVKPDKGQGSQGAKIVSSRLELEALSAKIASQELLVLELLPGNEYTIDCFTDRSSGLQYCGGRSRTRTRNGISVASVPVDDPQFRLLAEKINSKLEMHGAWFFQVKKAADGELVLLEVAPRIAGTMALNRVKGVNFPLLSIYESLGMPVEILTNTFTVQIDRALVNRYSHNLQYSTVYVDLDDTLLVKGKVNVSILSFLYQALNERKKIVLLTRHAGDLEETLARFRIAGVFDSVVHLKDGEPKSKYIEERSAIFIDDSFRERKDVASGCGIPTFDCSMVESLLDYRV